MRRLFLLSFLMLFSLPVCLGQNKNQIRRDKDDAKFRAERTAALRASLLSRIDDSVDVMDEPAMRALIRLRIATYLWSKRGPSPGLQAIAEREVEDALADIRAHKDEIPDNTEIWLHNELLAQVRLNAPALAARLKNKYPDPDPESPDDAFRQAYSLLNSPEGQSAALASLRRLVSSAQDPGPNLVFFLDRLEQQHSDALFPLLFDILAVEQGHPGTISLTTLEYVSRFYLQDDAPGILKVRFLGAVVEATRDVYAFPDAAHLLQARDFLRNVAPSIERLSPPLYARAMAQLSIISSRVPPDNVSMSTIAERVKRSQDPLDAWLAEADSPDNKFFRKDILREVAQLALEKKKFELAIETISKIEIRDEDKNARMWRAQFLAEVVDSALKSRNPEVARHAEARIEDSLPRTEALKKIAGYYFEAGNVPSAQQVLLEALKLAVSIEPASDRAAAYLDLSEAYSQVDASKVYEVISLAVKAVNGISTPNPEDKPGSAKRDAYARDLTALSWRLTPAFRSLVSRNEDDALYFADAIQRREMRAAALLGIYIGLAEIPVLASGKNAQ